MRPAYAVAHIGIAVPDVDAATEWYEKVFGFSQILPAGETDITAGGPFVDQTVEIFGPQIKRLKVANLSSANGCALELFEFIDPAYEKRADNFRYWEGGIFHFCVVAPDIEDLVQRIKDNGGKQRSDVRTIFEGMPYKASYCEDPWGTVIEATSHSHEQIFSNLA